MAKITILLLIITAINVFLQINKLETQSGYTKRRIREIEIVNQMTTVILFNEFKQIKNKILENNFNLYNRNDREMLYEKIKNIKAEINTQRKRRGILNIVGTTQKWLFGKMHNEDQNNILQHLEVIEKNYHNIIGAVNQQIYINNILFIKHMLRSNAEICN